MFFFPIIVFIVIWSFFVYTFGKWQKATKKWKKLAQQSYESPNDNDLEQQALNSKLQLEKLTKNFPYDFYFKLFLNKKLFQDG